MATIATRTEWIGGTFAFPSYVTDDDGEPFKPDAILWIVKDGPAVGMLLHRPGEAQERLVAHFLETTRSPLYGEPHTPSRVRIASEALAEELRAHLDPEIEIVCAPTPEIDRFANLLQERFEADDSDEFLSYLASGAEPEAVASFFRAAARMHQATPWERMPTATNLLQTTIEPLGVQRVASVMGELGHSFGFILFETLDDVNAFIEATRSMSEGGAPVGMPAYLALSFEADEDLDPLLREEATAHGWEIAGPNAYPRSAVVDEQLLARAPTGEELIVLEATALALAYYAEEAAQTEPPSGDYAAKTFAVDTYAGRLEVTVTPVREPTLEDPEAGVASGGDE